MMNDTLATIDKIKTLSNTAQYWNESAVSVMHAPGLTLGAKRRWRRIARRNRDQCIAEIQTLADELKEGVE